jgi:hypothetical protein
MRGRITFWLQLVSLLITGWLLWRPSWLGYWPTSPVWTLVRAAAFASMACIAAGLITLLLYLLLRQDPEYVIRGPLSTSTAAIWFAPAVILFSERSPAAIVAAIVLVVNATRVLYEQWRLSLVPSPEELPAELFSYYWTPIPSFWRLLAPALTGSSFVQLGIAAGLLRHPALAGLSLAMGAATITVFAQKSHAAEFQRPPNLPRSVLGLMLTMVLAIGLTVGGMLPRFGGHGFGAAGDGGPASAPAVATNEPPGQLPPDIPRGPADSGFFGVILWPEVKPYATLIEPMPQTRGGLGTAIPQRPWSIPFSGEYWMYRWPYAHPPQNSYFQRGNPADLSFSTTDHRPLQMEARHKLDQAVSVDCCSAIQIEVRNADRFAGTTALELYLIDRQSPRQFQMWVGFERLKSQPGISGDNIVPVRETLNFPMPAHRPIQQFDEFKLVFSRTANREDRSAKIAIERFVLIPR